MIQLVEKNDIVGSKRWEKESEASTRGRKG